MSRLEGCRMFLGKPLHLANHFNPNTHDTSGTFGLSRTKGCKGCAHRQFQFRPQCAFKASESDQV